MDFELSQEQVMMQDAIHASLSKLDASLPFANRWKEIAKTGIIGTCVDCEYGGLGLGAVDMLLMLEALAKTNSDNGLSFAIAAHTLACVIPIQKFGSQAQKEKYLKPLINGDMVMANAMTESESGSDVFNMQCKATKREDGFVLNGTKTFISNNSNSDLVLTYAVTNPEKGFFGGITAFLIERKNYSVGQQFSKMGLESCSLGEIIFENTLISPSMLLGKEGGGAVIFNHSMEWERICMTGLHLGTMQRVFQKTLQFVNDRKSAGQGIGKFQGISHSIADMQVLMEVSKSYAYKAAWQLDHKKEIGKAAAIAKLFVSNSVKTFMLQAMQIFGGYGYIKDYGIEQEVRDALAATIYSGTSEIQKNIIASNLGI